MENGKENFEEQAQESKKRQIVGFKAARSRATKSVISNFRKDHGIPKFSTVALPGGDHVLIVDFFRCFAYTSDREGKKEFVWVTKKFLESKFGHILHQLDMLDTQVSA